MEGSSDLDGANGKARKRALQRGTKSTEDGRGDKNNTPSDMYIPQWTEKFHFNGDFHRYSDS